jgi:hypothetical protein
MNNTIVELMDHVSGWDDEGMNTLRNVKPERNMTSHQMQGLAGWVWSFVKGWQGKRSIQQKQLRVVETLSLGGKRQIMLVNCGGESFLIGCGLDSVQVITALRTELPVHSSLKNTDGPC